MSTAKPGPISGTTGLMGLLGNPIRHSLSPTIHNAALQALGIDWVYLALPVEAAELAGVMRALEALDCHGLSVTLPHKRAVAALVAERSPLAERLGAVNTLVRRQAGGWLGTNTDVEGFMAPLRANDWQGRRAVVLGCGGSALAVVAGLEMLGFASIQVAGRDPAKLEAFCSGCRSWLPQLESLAWSGEGSQDGAAADPLAAALASADLVVNTTPVGMANSQDPTAASRCPLGAAALNRLPQGCTVYDLIYTPQPTALLKAARARGCRCIDGLEMLVHQGAAALTLWTGRETIPVDVMRGAALKALEAP